MRVPKQKILIVANSARMLAQLANKSGYQPIVIDCFADKDTQTAAIDFCKIQTLALKNIQKAVFDLQDRHSFVHVIYGSGFEYHNDSLAFLHQNYIVLGNSYDCFIDIQNKPYFFSQLDRLHIPYPETLFSPPLKGSNWLHKPLRGEGGLGIKKYQPEINNLDTNYYWQKKVVGEAMSVLFIANGLNFEVIGFHQQQVLGLEGCEFIFSSIVNKLNVDKAIELTIVSWLGKLVTHFKLQGLNSLDFIASGTDCYVLEINARPSASMQLYSNDLISAHINSIVSGELTKQVAGNSYHGYQIIYAETDLTLNKNICWPEWVVDIPDLDGLIHTSMPICSIIASDKSQQQVLDLLLLRRQQLNKLLYR